LNFGGMVGVGADAVMEWHDIQNPDDKLLDELAAGYSPHPLHVEDCRQDAQRIKAEAGEGYVFISLKQIAFDDSGRLATGDVVLFVGCEFLLTVHRAPVALLEPLRAAKEELHPELYRVVDTFVESYIPLVEQLERDIERLEDVVVGAPRPTVLENIGEARSTLLELRRVLNATRHVVVQLRHVPGPLINQELSPFLRDLHDDLAIILDSVSAGRDRLAGALDLYMSSIANRNAEARRP
jgi:magnesium transporter